MTHRLIGEELYQGIGKYLMQRPYHEVAQAMPDLAQARSVLSLFEALAACIRTGQVPQEDVPKLLEANPEFAAWYKNG
jgi:hypothetical protein